MCLWWLKVCKVFCSPSSLPDYPLPSLRSAMAFRRLSGIPRSFLATDRSAERALQQRGCRVGKPYFARYDLASRPCDARCFPDSILNPLPHSRQTTLFFWMDLLASPTCRVAPVLDPPGLVDFVPCNSLSAKKVSARAVLTSSVVICFLLAWVRIFQTLAERDFWPLFSLKKMKYTGDIVTRTAKHNRSQNAAERSASGADFWRLCFCAC